MWLYSAMIGKNSVMEKRIITINNESFKYVKTRVYTPVSIYRNGGVFLKVGPKGLIQKELRIHKNLLKVGFPVAEIIKEGVAEDNNYYYTEKSLGDNHLGHIFSKDYEKMGVISEKHFTNLLLLTEKFAEAQIKTGEKEHFPEDFYLGVNLNYIIKELPHLKKNILEAFEKVVKKLSVFPFVITHGDFNPHNLLAKGVIDFAETFYAPAGHDLIVNIFHIFLFPKNKDYELVRRYEFSPEQIKQYLAFVDNIG